MHRGSTKLVVTDFVENVINKYCFKLFVYIGHLNRFKLVVTCGSCNEEFSKHPFTPKLRNALVRLRFLISRIDYFSHQGCQTEINQKKPSNFVLMVSAKCHILFQTICERRHLSEIAKV